MIKGCTKKMIFVKDTGSDFFEEAYFILKEDFINFPFNENDIVKVATEIIDNYELPKEREKPTFKFSKFVFGLISGIGIGVGITALLFILI